MRAQAHTLEGVAAALIVVASVFFALQMTAVTPLTASTANQHIENQEQAAVRGVLATAAANGSLRRTALTWNASEDRFPNATGGTPYYGAGQSPTRLVDALDATFRGRAIAYNVNLVYLDANGTRHRKRFYYSGSPTSNAVAVARTVTLYDDDHEVDASGDSTGRTVGGNGFYAPDADPSTSYYNAVRVEVVVWRM